jgi:hypothetical protein
MKNLIPAAFIIGGLLSPAATIPANAATITLDWTLSGPAASLGGLHFTGSGTLTATIGPASDLVTAITGTVTDGTVVETITGLAPTGTLNSNDNLLFPIGTNFVGPPVSSTPYVSVSDLDSHGIAFTIAAGPIDVFGFSAPNQTPAPNPANNNYGELSPEGFGVGNFAVTPLPAALPLFATGLGALGLLGWRRKRKNAAADIAA